MDCSDTTDLNRKVLRRIVALLWALALLAERASLRSQAVRWSVLWLLAPGEMVARTYVAAVTGNPGLAGPALPVAMVRAGDRPEDALRLAQAFRRLAAALALLLEQIGGWEGAEIGQAGSTGATRDAARALPEPILAVARRDSS